MQHPLGQAGRRGAALALSLVVIVIDQVTKAVVLVDVHGPLHLFGPLGIRLGTNTGIAFSLLSGNSAVLGVALAAVAGIVGVALWRTKRTAEALALGLVLGGALSNLLDRAARRHHAVVDFLTLPHWATFNLADAAITVGVIWLALALLRGGGAVAHG